MKKTLIFAAFFAAMAMVGYGGNALVTHAQTANTQDSATLQQQLDAAKAQLIQLQMQAGQVPAGDNSLPQGTATAMPATGASATASTGATLSPADISQMNTALTALANLLVTLQNRISQDPQFIASNAPVVISALQNIGQTVNVIGNEIETSHLAMAAPQATPPMMSGAGSPATNVAQGNSAAAGAGSSNSASDETTQSGASAQVDQGTQSTAAAGTDSGNTSPANNAPQTAQASSAFSLSKLNWPLIIVIILIVAAIAMWLWWDDGEDKKPVVKNQTAPQRPQQPVVQIQNNQNIRQPAPSQTPLSSAVTPQASH